MAFPLGKIVFIARFVALAILIICSLVALAVSAHFFFITQNRLGGYFYFSPLVIAVGGLSFLSLLACVVLDLVTRGKIFSSKIAFEVGWLGFLFVAWIGAAGYSAWTNEQAFGSNDDCNYRNATLRTMCYELPVVVAFSFLAAFITFFYVVLLIVFTLIRRRDHLLSKSVRDASLLHATPSTAVGLQAAKQDYHTHAQPVGYAYLNTGPAQGYYTQGVPPMQYPGGAIPPSPYTQSSTVPYQTTPFETPSPANTQYTQPSMYPQPQGPAQAAYPNYQGTTPPNATGYPLQHGFQQPQHQQ